jgi:hypothetical protein
MEKYIKISIIIIFIILILFLIYKKYTLKNDIIEHFNNYEIISEEGLGIINNLETEYNKINTVSKFNILNSVNINTKSLNNHSIINLTTTEPVLGDILRYSTNSNSWVNDSPKFPQVISLNIMGTPKPITNTAVNLLAESSYAFYDSSKSILNLSEKNKFNLPPNVESNIWKERNKYYVFYGPPNPVTKLGGLRFDNITSKIIGFDPKKMYKIDCTISFYSFAESAPGNARLRAFITSDTDKNQLIADTYNTVYAEDQTVVLRLGGYKTGIPYNGIGVYVNKMFGNDLDFRGWTDRYKNDPAWYPQANITLVVEEIRRGV